MPEEPSPTSEEAATSGMQTADSSRRQVLDLVPVLPFEDDPATFLRVLAELADRYAGDGRA